MHKQFLVGPVAILLALAGCATHSDSIQAANVSEAQYANLSCDQIGAEMARVRQSLDDVVKKQNASANADTTMTGVGVLLFPPLLLGLAATSDNKVDVARLKGEHEAVQRAAASKNCKTAA